MYILKNEKQVERDVREVRQTCSRDNMFSFISFLNFSLMVFTPTNIIDSD